MKLLSPSNPGLKGGTMMTIDAPGADQGSFQTCAWHASINGLNTYIFHKVGKKYNPFSLPVPLSTAYALHSMNLMNRDGKPIISHRATMNDVTKHISSLLNDYKVSVSGCKGSSDSCNGTYSCNGDRFYHDHGVSVICFDGTWKIQSGDAVLYSNALQQKELPVGSWSASSGDDCEVELVPLGRPSLLIPCGVGGLCRFKVKAVGGPLENADQAFWDTFTHDLGGVIVLCPMKTTGELHFMCALSHTEEQGEHSFQCVNSWGDVRLVSVPGEDFDVAAEVYQIQIIEESLEIGKESDFNGRFEFHRVSFADLFALATGQTVEQIDIWHVVMEAFEGTIKQKAGHEFLQQKLGVESIAAALKHFGIKNSNGGYCAMHTNMNDVCKQLNNFFEQETLSLMLPSVTICGRVVPLRECRCHIKMMMHEPESQHNHEPRKILDYFDTMGSGLDVNAMIFHVQFQHIAYFCRIVAIDRDNSTIWFHDGIRVFTWDENQSGFEVNSVFILVISDLTIRTTGSEDFHKVEWAELFGDPFANADKEALAVLRERMAQKDLTDRACKASLCSIHSVQGQKIRNLNLW